MRTVSFTRWRGVVLGAAATTLLLAGCASSPAPTSTPSASPSPPLLTEKEALDIAVTTYDKYLAASGEVYEHGQEAADQFKAVATGEFGQGELEKLLTKANSRDLVAEGQVRVVKAQVKKIKPESIEVYLCTDASNAFLYERGAARPERKQNIYSLEVRLLLVDGTFRVERSDTWDGTSFCDEFRS